MNLKIKFKDKIVMYGRIKDKKIADKCEACVASNKWFLRHRKYFQYKHIDIDSKVGKYIADKYHVIHMPFIVHIIRDKVNGQQIDEPHRTQGWNEYMWDNLVESMKAVQ